MIENEIITPVKTEATSTAGIAYQSIVDNLIDKEPEVMELFAEYLRQSDLHNISFLIAQSVAAFIRQDFAIPETRFSAFVNGEDTLSDMEVEGAIYSLVRESALSAIRAPTFRIFSFMQLAFHSLVSDETDSVLITEDTMQRTTLQIYISSAYPLSECIIQVLMVIVGRWQR